MRKTFFVLFSILLLFAPALVAQGHSGGCQCGGFSTSRVQWELELEGDPSSAAYKTGAADEFDRWNSYIDLFDYRNGDGRSGVNQVNEVALLSIAQTRTLYGININKDVFGFAFMSPESAFGDFNVCPTPAAQQCGTFSETDVIVNREFVRGFKPNGPIDFDDDRGPAFFGATLVHELGHTLGFHHNFTNLSVMNYYEDFAARYIAYSDVEVARSGYPAQARSVTDLAVYPFSFDASQQTYRTTTPVTATPTAILPGGSITLDSFGFENVGTTSVSNAEIRFYLSVDDVITTSDVLIGGFEFAGAVAPGAFWDDETEGEMFSVPSTVRPGRYYIGALAVHGGGQLDGVSYNNSWIAPQQITVIQPGGSQRKRPVKRP